MEVTPRSYSATGLGRNHSDFSHKRPFQYFDNRGPYIYVKRLFQSLGPCSVQKKGSFKLPREVRELHRKEVTGREAVTSRENRCYSEKVVTLEAQEHK